MDVAGLLQFSQTHLEVFVGVGSALIAMISALIARGETKRQRKLQTANLRQAIDAASLDWGNAAIDTMARCAMFARTRQKQTFWWHCRRWWTGAGYFFRTSTPTKRAPKRKVPTAATARQSSTR
jgi:hypothetical protein